MNDQTQLRVRTNVVDTSITGLTGTLSYNQNATTYAHVVGSGTTTNPYTGTTISTNGMSSLIFFKVNDTEGVLHYTITTSNDNTSSITLGGGSIFAGTGDTSASIATTKDKDVVVKLAVGSTIVIYFIPTVEIIYLYENLDIYGDIPIKLNKSFAEIQDISKKNSDHTVGVILPGSKKNNRFFENFFNVDNVSYYFNPTKRIPCDVLINNELYFSGYLKLNNISVKDTEYEYDIILYSSAGSLFGNIGNNFISDLDFDDPEYNFNHIFSPQFIKSSWETTPLLSDSAPPMVVYPVVHNGYLYSGKTVNFSGGTRDEQTRLFTGTDPIGSWGTPQAAYDEGVEEYRLNSPTHYLRDNQLKPGISYWGLIKLIFKTYGYTIKSDFMNTPWAKMLYMYGPFSESNIKLSYKKLPTETLPREEVDVIIFSDGEWTLPSTPCDDDYWRYEETLSFIPVKKGTNTPCLCSDELSIGVEFTKNLGLTTNVYMEYVTIEPLSVVNSIVYWKISWVDTGSGCPYTYQTISYNAHLPLQSNVTVVNRPLAYWPLLDTDTDTVIISDGDKVDFSLVLDQATRQIDILSSFMKKFNLIIFQEGNDPNELTIEPYDYYVGTGTEYDWTDKLAVDKGFIVEPAQNYIESSITLTESEGTDTGNVEFKNKFGKIFGENIKNSPTEFKTSDKKIETLFSPSAYRFWYNYCRYPLLTNYVESGEDEDGVVTYFYKGVKTKPKIFWYLGSYNPFLKQPNVYYENHTVDINTYQIKLQGSKEGYSLIKSDIFPLIYNDTNIGLTDEEKITNDSTTLSFLSENNLILSPFDDNWLSFNNVSGFNSFTNVNAYDTWYSSRIDNIYNPNTRHIKGKFNLSLSDVKDLKPNDIIKIKEQKFTWNKIDQFNLTNNELTNVELVQYQVTPKEYPIRYFKYYYCSNPNFVYKFKTDFTNTSPLKSAQYFSVTYDYLMGVKKQFSLFFSDQTGYTSTFLFENEHYSYDILEITKTEYENTNLIDWKYDPILKGLENMSGEVFKTLVPYFVSQPDGDRRVNLFNNCSDIAFDNLTMGTIGDSLDATGYNFYDYEVAINDSTEVPNKYLIYYYDIDGVYQNVEVTNLVNYVVEGAREYSLMTESNGIEWEKVRYSDTTNYDPVTGLKDPPNDSDLDKAL